MVSVRVCDEEIGASDIDGRVGHVLRNVNLYAGRVGSLFGYHVNDVHLRGDGEPIRRQLKHASRMGAWHLDGANELPVRIFLVFQDGFRLRTTHEDAAAVRR